MTSARQLHAANSRPGGALSRFVFSQKLVEQRIRTPEVRPLKHRDRLGKIHKASAGGEIQNTKSSGNPQTVLLGQANASPVVNQQKIGAHGTRQRYRRSFSLMKAGGTRNGRGAYDLDPRRRILDPGFYWERRIIAGKLGLNHGRKNYPFEKPPENVDVPDKNQVVYRACIGDYQTHGLEADFF